MVSCGIRLTVDEAADGRDRALDLGVMAASSMTESTASRMTEAIETWRS